VTRTLRSTDFAETRTAAFIKAQRFDTPAEVDRILAVDWSGDRSVAGQRRKIWAGVWTRLGAVPVRGREPRATVFGGTVALESGRTRAELTEWLIAQARETPRMAVAIDCCFSFPGWFLAEHGCSTVVDFWQAVADGKGEAWLHRECADDRFWGVTGPARSGKRPAEFSGVGLRRMMRSTDWENKIAVRQEGGDAERAEKMRGITAKSPFQIGGSGSVGTGSLRAMPMLLALREAGFRIWPFEDAALGWRAEGRQQGQKEQEPRPLVLEMYTRLLTGPVAKSNAEARRAYLLARRGAEPDYAALTRPVLAKAEGSEDAFDALVCAVEIARHRTELPPLRATLEPELQLEGITWRPGV
jgi:hypothetical protein